MSNKDIDHKQLIVAKCYELALLETQIIGVIEDREVDGIAMSYLDRIMKAADIWKGS
jgi:hypothetical protein|tara:strand:+ start:1135 stop:1305 length:171 start_codon:yes stop_codon:yes gene_type:complete